ncbi:MAG: hypothetical protein JXQ23_06210 [Clostridia bacterium]|nr:hypothetical protein [Clostridia bacterium]
MNQTETAKKTCLNGWWDFQPVFHINDDLTIPESGWAEKKYMVPSFFTKPLDGVRKKGEVYFTDRRKDQKVLQTDDYEFLYDAYRYPNEWSMTRAAWIKREYVLDKKKDEKRYFLLFEAVEPKGAFFLNGQKIGENIHPTLPFEADVTDVLIEGNNEIAVLITDYERDSKGRIMVPSGNNIPCQHSGIWQDVYLIEKNEVFVSDITITTSVRKGNLSVFTKITNASDSERVLTVESFVTDWSKDEVSLEIRCKAGNDNIRLAPFTTGDLTFENRFSDAIWWEPSNPKLYLLHTLIRQDGKIISYHTERFGFREVWIEGKDIMLNDHPVHLFSDWGHKVTPYHHTREWIIQWFNMIRDLNMNHSRLHTHPHPKLYLELADEMGILITGETGLHGSGGEQASESLLYYERAFEHIEKFVRRDKNHPSIILWSVENEMRWNALDDTSGLMQEYLPKLKEHFNFLDPTRPAYHEGDSSLWNEKNQDIISRHYGKECSGIGWWDQTQPLHSGEMSLYHYSGPNNCGQLGGDEVFSDYKVMDRAASMDTSYIVEAGRTLGVSCFGPWNMSCLENLRMEEKEIELSYDDYESPGVKPLYVQPHSSEFEFYHEGKGYTPISSFDIQKKAFRPFAVIDLSQKTNYFENQLFRHRLTMVNDMDKSVRGTLEVSMKNRQGDILKKEEWTVSVSRGGIEYREISMKMPLMTEKTAIYYEAVFTENSLILDTWRKELNGWPDLKLSCPETGIYGNRKMEAVLKNTGLKYRYVSDWTTLLDEGIRVVIVEPEETIPGSTQNKDIREYMKQGGRVILLEQSVSLFPTVNLEEKQVLASHIRAFGHPVFNEIDDTMLRFFGEDPYPLLAGDSYVATKMYVKDCRKGMLVLSDSGDGAFGDGNLSYTPLFEIKEEAGLLLSCQFRIMDKLLSEPCVRLLLSNMLAYAFSYEPADKKTLHILENFNKKEAEQAIETAKAGGNVLVINSNQEQLDWFNHELGTSLLLKKTDAVYQAVRSRYDDVLNGISNEDTCGITTFCYSSTENINQEIGSVFLSGDEKCEVLLETPTGSALKELFVMGGKSEILKTHTLSRFLHKEKPERLSVLSRFKMDDGAVYFLQFEHINHFTCFKHRLTANLGFDHKASLLEGECVPDIHKNSDGFPEKMYVYGKEVNDATWENMLQCTVPSMERMATAPILNMGDWEQFEGESGNFMVDYQNSYLYYRIYSPVARKNVKTNLGVPNPMMLTFLDISGVGEAHVFVNGVSYGKVKVNDAATISDISLEKDFNHILIRWGTKDTMLSLKMQWRNIMRQPETSFRFL